MLAAVEVGDEPVAALEDEVHLVEAEFAGGLSAGLPEVADADHGSGVRPVCPVDGLDGIGGESSAISGH